MWIRPAIALIGLIGSCAAASAQDFIQNFRIEEANAPQSFNVAQIKPGTIAFGDQADGAKPGDKSGAKPGDEPALTPFEAWAQARPAQKKFLSLFPGYVEPTVPSATAGKGPITEKLYMYVAQARFVLDRPPGAIDLSRYVTLPFLQKIDPAIKHKAIAAADLPSLKDTQGTGNANPDRPWCTGRAALLCIESSYALEGKIPLGIMLVNKLRDSAKKISDHIDFDGELSQLLPADVDQAGLQELTGLETPVAGVLEQNIFYVNQIMKFGKFYAVFQDDPADAGKTVVTAYMTLAIEGGVFDKKREFENVPVLRNLVPEQVLLGKSSFNSGESISAGLPKYARNEIRTIAGLLQHDTAK